MQKYGSIFDFQETPRPPKGGWFFKVTFLLLLTLKLTGLSDVSWWWVWLPIVFWVLVLIGIVFESYWEK